MAAEGLEGGHHTRHGLLQAGQDRLDHLDEAVDQRLDGRGDGLEEPVEGRLHPHIAAATESIALSNGPSSGLAARARESLMLLPAALKWRFRTSLSRSANAPSPSRPPPSPPATPMATLTPDQARALMEAAAGSWLRMLVLLGLATGARLGELLALRWSDLDLDAGVARISRSAQLVDGRVRFKPPKTSAGVRPVALGPATVAALRRHRADQLELRLASAGVYDTEADLVLAKADGSACRPDSASTMFRKLVDRGRPAARGPRAHPAPLGGELPGR